jgi:RNA recognition motif-containing protein
MEEELKKIYLGNLAFSLTAEDVEKALQEKGINATAVRVVTDKFTGRSKGFGFAEFATEEETNKAIDALNGQELGGRPLQVNRAKKMQPRTDRPSRSFGGGEGRGDRGEGRFNRR